MTLYLFPNTLGSRKASDLPPAVGEAVKKIHGLIAESDKGGRSFLKLWEVSEVHKFPLAILPKKAASKKDYDFYLEPLVKSGESWGVVSDAGLPCVADPGALLVARAREKGLVVKGFSGPCSITLSLMLSGLPGQKFTFLGYLPKTPKDREKLFASAVRTKGETKIFIEAPYRNVHVFKSALEFLPKQALFCVASELSTEDELVQTHSIEYWRTFEGLEAFCERISKTPTIFLFHVF
ncbi:SAM-dependent methyltransferase [Chlamydiifrater phoenicopteri]|uniref:SAM-dependent methyltransferase n=1 Tax=Chlamydiifrater phoenicopteri TaxID=2681469 RepID=UPI001BD0278B|nr:SAM-dependent methyltransferase [Chlamydiifrater phoenicopteri]